MYTNLRITICEMNYTISPYWYGVCDTRIAEEVLVRIQIDVVITQITPVTPNPPISNLSCH